MKTIVKKILEAGLVEKNAVQLMEKWGSLDRGASDLVGRKDLRAATESTLTKFAEEVDDLMEKEREELREARLAIQVGEPFLANWLGSSTKMVLFKDNMGNFMFPLMEASNLIPGAEFEVSNGERWEVLVITKLYLGEQAYAFQVLAK